ncbi:MAG: NUDIX hydrolase [Rhodobacteraceae bacterium]|nr:NUDIX hydrolase [Paracoccaceae bacterium]
MRLQKFPSISEDLQAVLSGDVQSQFGALCYRWRGKTPEVLLITSRGAGRWIVPKGWPIRGETPAGSALTEAYEEAGVRGIAHPICLGIYTYAKPETRVVALFPIRVKRLLNKYPEMAERKRKWVGIARAAELVDIPELGELIQRFDPARLGI